MKSTRDPRVGVVVGRFQVDQLHQGHLKLLNHVAETHTRFLILVGVRPAEPSDTNPLGFEDRYLMLAGYYPRAIILPVRDCRSDEVWSTQVDQLIQSIFGFTTGALFHVGRDSFISHYTGQYPVEEHDFGIDELAARGIREEIRDRALVSENGRAGAIKAIMNQPHRTTIMVDMFMVKDDTEGSYDVLVGKKEGEDLWRLPGGHVDPGESFEMAASREMREETNMTTSSGVASWKYIGNYDVSDWRCRDTNRIHYRTVLMTAEYFSGKAEARSDLIEVTWLRLDQLKNLGDTLIVEEHRHLLAAAINHFDKNPPHFVRSKQSTASNNVSAIEA